MVHSHKHSHENTHHEHEHTHHHEHEHEHSHHEHEHSHHESEDIGVSKDEMTLRILLVHWVKHNQSHEKDFKEWVQKAKEMKKEEVGSYIESAIAYMEKANEMLMEAKKHM